jgi:hypothetical protein
VSGDRSHGMSFDFAARPLPLSPIGRRTAEPSTRFLWRPMNKPMEMRRNQCTYSFRHQASMQHDIGLRGRSLELDRQDLQGCEECSIICARLSTVALVPMLCLSDRLHSIWQFRALGSSVSCCKLNGSTTMSGHSLSLVSSPARHTGYSGPGSSRCHTFLCAGKSTASLG